MQLWLSKYNVYRPFYAHFLFWDIPADWQEILRNEVEMRKKLHIESIRIRLHVTSLSLKSNTVLLLLCSQRATLRAARLQPNQVTAPNPIISSFFPPNENVSKQTQLKGIVTHAPQHGASVRNIY